MALDLATLNGHLARIISDLPVRFQWNGLHEGVKSSPAFTETVIIGGVDQIIDFILFVKRDTIPSIPAIGEVILVETVSGNFAKCRVYGVKQSPDNSQLLSLQMGFSRKA